MRKSVNARAAGLMIFPATNSALTSIEPKFQSGGIRPRGSMANETLDWRAGLHLAEPHRFGRALPRHRQMAP